MDQLRAMEDRKGWRERETDRQTDRLRASKRARESEREREIEGVSEKCVMLAQHTANDTFINS